VLKIERIDVMRSQYGRRPGELGIREDILRFLWIIGVRGRQFETNEDYKCDRWRRRRERKEDK